MPVGRFGGGRWPRTARRYLGRRFSGRRPNRTWFWKYDINPLYNASTTQDAWQVLDMYVNPSSSNERVVINGGKGIVQLAWGSTVGLNYTFKAKAIIGFLKVPEPAAEGGVTNSQLAIALNAGVGTLDRRVFGTQLIMASNATMPVYQFALPKFTIRPGERVVFVHRPEYTVSGTDSGAAQFFLNCLFIARSRAFYSSDAP